MKQLIIIGARGWGRECYSLAHRTDAYKNGEYEVKGFLDSNSNAFEGLKGDFPPILGDVESYVVKPDDVFVCAMGKSYWRRYYADIIEKKGGVFISLISSKAIIFENAEIDYGCIVSDFSIISDNVRLGKHVMIHPSCVLGHDVKVGDYASLYFDVFLGGYVKIGESAEMNPKSMVIPHKTVGKNAVVGAASVVIRNVKDNAHVFGNPAVAIDC